MSDLLIETVEMLSSTVRTVPSALLVALPFVTAPTVVITPVESMWKVKSDTTVKPSGANTSRSV